MSAPASSAAGWRTATLAAGLVLAGMTAGQASAHGGLHADDSPWAAWHLSPDIVVGTLLVAAFYAAGLWRRRHKSDPARVRGHLWFYAGLGAVFLALQSPLDALAERVFFMHQVQHLLLRMIGPMMIMLAAPQALLVAGTPDALRRRVVAPILTNGPVRGIFGLLAHPAAATVLFIAALYFWQIPRYHNLALLNDSLHYLMHVSMLFAGLLFFWRVFDIRPAPAGTPYGVRLMMLWAAILSNILLGAYLTLKGGVLYPAYDELGRLWGLTALGDEQLGGAIIWIPSSMMGLIAVLIVIHMWGRHETRAEERRGLDRLRHRAPGDAGPTTSAEMIQRQAPVNRAMALGFIAFVAAVFATAIVVGVLSRMSGM